MSKTYVNTLPANAIQCIGPLMYDLKRYISPDGNLFSMHPTTGRIQQITISKQNKWSWKSAKQLLPDGSTENMESIDGFYESSNGRVTITALMAYYFIEKINPNGMRAIKIDPEGPLNVTNLQWGTKHEQDCHRLDQARALVNPENIYKNAEDVNIDEYIEWNDSSYFVKHDGARVLKKINDNKYREIVIRESSDGYMNVTLHIDGNATCIRINRLIANIHHGLDLESDLVVDHKNGNITDNNPSNLEIVTLQENTQRGNSACSVIKVDPNTMKIVEDIRCLKEYTDNNPNQILKTIRRIRTTNEIYNNFHWLDKQLIDILYTVDDGIVKFIQMDLNNVLKHIRITIKQYCNNNVITKSIVPIDANGLVLHTDEIIDIVNNLDPRGIGREDDMSIIQNFISGHMPCCRLISYHGNCSNNQLVLCLKTLLIFSRSVDNLNQKNRLCPLCNREGTQFMPTDPEMGIPVYSYNAAAGKQSNDDPLAFRNSYLTIYEPIKENYSPSKLKSIRQSLFELANKISGSWVKQTDKLTRTKGFPKRVLSDNLYWSFYPPRNGYLSETNPDWLLHRRLRCAVMVSLKAAVEDRQIFHSS